MYSANNRFTYGPYKKLAYPYQVYYPAYTYPKVNMYKGRVRESPQVNTSSLDSLTKNALKNTVVSNKINSRIDNKIDDRMNPYIFRHYIPPTYYELWDYNQEDMEKARYNEMLRQEIVSEVYNAPGSYKKVRR
jgi:hypothetical protein